jgi:hypothetical protein
VNFSRKIVAFSLFVNATPVSQGWFLSSIFLINDHVFKDPWYCYPTIPTDYYDNFL